MIRTDSLKPIFLAHLVHSAITRMASTTLSGRTRSHSDVASFQCPASQLHTVGCLETISDPESWRRLLPPLCIPPVICQTEQQCTPVSSTGGLAWEEPTSLAELSLRQMAVVQSCLFSAMGCEIRDTDRLYFSEVQLGQEGGCFPLEQQG